MLCCAKFSVTLHTEILSTGASDFLKQIIFLKSFNSVLKIVPSVKMAEKFEGVIIHLKYNMMIFLL